MTDPVAGTGPSGSLLKIWWLAIRPKTLWAAFVPILVGSAIAFEEGNGHWPAAVLALLGALAIQIGTNLANDYSDFRRGADTRERKGPTRVTQSGLLDPKTVLIGTAIAFGLAFLAGLYLIARAGVPILVVGVLSIISGILYTAGPKPLGYIGLGDVFVLLFFGPVAVAGTHYVQAVGFSWIAAAAGLGPGLIAVALLSVNNLRDVDDDVKAGKRTLAVRFGRRFARWEYVVCIVAAGFVPLALYAVTGTHAWSLVACGLPVLAAPAFRRILGGLDGAALNPLLGFTGRLSIAYSVIFSVAWLI